ncbi:MAG: hypothetical protein E5Y69_08830 [Mesorhizobium sp.]|nr:MAG: hypothetical protein E5Y69_08830 [Mesorhizobium sp.]
MRGVPAWQRQRSVQHPSTVSALRADPPSPTTRGEGNRALRHQLVFIKLLVEAALPEQRPVRAAFHHFAGFQNHDRVGLVHGRQPVGDDDGGAPDR